MFLFEHREGSREAVSSSDRQERRFFRRHSVFSTQTSECECKYSRPVLCQLQSDIFTAFSHAYHSAHPPCLPPNQSLTMPSLYPHEPNTHLETSFYTCTYNPEKYAPPTHTHTLLSGEDPSQDLWQRRLGVQLFQRGAETIECLSVYLFYSSCFAFIKRNNETLLNRLEEGRKDLSTCVTSYLQVKDSCTAKKKKKTHPFLVPPPPKHTHTQLALAVSETGLWDPVIWMDRVQTRLMSSCSFLSNATGTEHMEGWRWGGRVSGEKGFTGNHRGYSNIIDPAPVLQGIVTFTPHSLNKFLSGAAALFRSHLKLS